MNVIPQTPLPQVVAAVLRASQALVDQLAALGLVAGAHVAVDEGGFSGWAFEHIIAPLNTELQVGPAGAGRRARVAGAGGGAGGRWVAGAGGRAGVMLVGVLLVSSGVCRCDGGEGRLEDGGRDGGKPPSTDHVNGAWLPPA